MTAKRDLIFRSDAIKALNCDFSIDGKENAEKICAYINGAYKKIKALPSAGDPVTGKWVYKDYGWRCSVCRKSPTEHTGVTLSEDELKDYHFCRWCGALMSINYQEG